MRMEKKKFKFEMRLTKQIEKNRFTSFSLIIIRAILSARLRFHADFQIFVANLIAVHHLNRSIRFLRTKKLHKAVT
jgi:hypothetical protein